MAEHVGTAIGISGVRKTVAALKAFAPDIESVMDATIKESLKATQAAAKSAFPDGSWVIGRSKKKLLGYIAARAGGRRAPRWGDSSGGIKAAVFEFAGSAQAGKTPQARGLINYLQETYGAPGRFLWEAWDSTGQDVLDQIGEALHAAEAAMQARLDAAGEAY